MRGGRRGVRGQRWLDDLYTRPCWSPSSRSLVTRLAQGGAIYASGGGSVTLIGSFGFNDNTAKASMLIASIRWVRVPFWNLQMSPTVRPQKSRPPRITSTHSKPPANGPVHRKLSGRSVGPPLIEHSPVAPFVFVPVSLGLCHMCLHCQDVSKPKG